jgi:hypothetical protein
LALGRPHGRRRGTTTQAVKRIVPDLRASRGADEQCHAAEHPPRIDDRYRERRRVMGDKGGKKDKQKSQKQTAQKQDQRAKEKRNKQEKSTP